MIQNIIGIISIAFIAGYIFYLLVKEEKAPAIFLFSAALLTTACLHGFDLLAVNDPDRFILYKRLALFAESLLPALWLSASLTYYRKDVSGSSGLFQKAALMFSPLFLAAVVLIPIDKLYYAPDFDIEKIIFLGKNGFAFYIGILVYMIIALVNFEMTLLTAARTDRWRIKFDLLGAGALVAVLVFYFCQGLLYRTINMNLLPVRSVVMIVAVLLMAYSRTKRGSNVTLYVSKRIAFRSIVILAVGLYLIVLGLMGEGMRYFSKETQNALLVSFVFLGVIGMLVLLMSESLKRKLKVVLHKNFYSNKYDYRAQWLHFTERISLAKTEQEVLQAILDGFRETFGLGTAAFYLKDAGADEYRLAAPQEMKDGASPFSDDNALVRYMKKEKRIFNSRDGIVNVMQQNKDFLDRSGTEFVVPLQSGEEMLGFIALARPLHKGEVYTYEDYDLMNTLARQVYSVILNMRLADELSLAREMEMIGKISSFVIHDLKNLTTALSLILENAGEHIDNPDFQKDMLQSLDSTIHRMKNIIARLRDMREKDKLSLQVADLKKLATDTIAQVKNEGITLQGSAVFAEVDVEEIQKVLLNLVLNAVDASSETGRITIETGDKEMAYIKVSDQGCGISPEFQKKHLFKPFSTTKQKGLGIGLYQCKQIIEAHNGRIELESEPGKGSAFTVFLPRSKKVEYAAEEIGA